MKFGSKDKFRSKNFRSRNFGSKIFEKKVTKLSQKKFGPKILVQKNVVSEIWWGSYCYIGKQSQLLSKQGRVSSS